MTDVNTPGAKVVDVIKTVVPDTTVIPPITVTVIGDSNTPPSGTVITTPGNHPNIIQNVITPFVAITVRFINAYLTMLVGLLSAGMTTNLIPAVDFAHLLMKCAELSIAGASLGLLKDIITISAKLEQKYPLGTGSI
jgi:hypothetical protein